MFRYNKPYDLRNTLCFNFQTYRTKNYKREKHKRNFAFSFFVFVVPYQSPNLTYQAVNQNQTGKVD